MKKLNAFLVSVLSAAALNAAVIEQVIVRQQWPWSTDIKVEYKLSGVAAGCPVDVAIKAYNGVVELPLPAAAVEGDLYGIAEDGVGTIVIDPVAAFGTGKVALANFKVKLTVSESSSNINEVLYKIFDLDTGRCVDVTRKDILNGQYGAYEVDYAKIGPGFTTGLQDVLIWTGVTNNPAYKTTHLVMRKIPAKDVVWPCGDVEGTLSSRAALRERKYVKLTYDYFVGVFEVTQAQHEKVFGSNPSTFQSVENAGWHPVEGAPRYAVHSNPNPSGNKGVITGETVAWPTNSYLRDVTSGTFMDKLRKLTAVEFDLPTAAEWQFANRAESETPLYSGKAQTEANVAELAWYSGNAGSATHVVGGLPPNAYGLYDLLGNVAEYVHNYESIHGGTEGSGSEGDPCVNPVGSRDAAAMFAGTVNPWYMGGSWKADAGYWQDLRQACAVNWYKWSQANANDTLAHVGVRVVCPVSSQWAEH